MDTSTTGCDHTDSRSLYYCLPALPDGYEWDWLHKEPVLQGRRVWITGQLMADPWSPAMIYAMGGEFGTSYEHPIHGITLPSDEALQLIAVNCWLGVIR